MPVRGGLNTSGAGIGILVLDTRFPRIVGDIGNARTFPFPVVYRRVPMASSDRVVRQGDPALLPAFIEGAQELERDGVKAITTSCGFLAKFQCELAAAVRVPVFTSSLLQVPLVGRMLAPGRAVGILTISAGSLGAEHLLAVGIAPDIPLVIGGTEGEKEFTQAILDDRPELDVETARADVVRAAKRLVDEHPEVGAIVLGCTNMPPYRADIQQATGLPIFDVVTLVSAVHSALAHSLPPLSVMP
ncbi:MAG: aspartate/glutamate racemase family protein [Candidatus Methylomirabilia bacterium]